MLQQADLRKESVKRLVITFVFAFILLCLFIGTTYAWFISTALQRTIIIDSTGIQLGQVELRYIRDPNFTNGTDNVPSDIDFADLTGESPTAVIQERGDINGELIDDQFYLGSRIYYRMQIENAASNETFKNGGADISLAFSDLNEYYNQAYASLAAPGSTLTIDDINISNYSGVLLFKLGSLKYKVVPNDTDDEALALVPYTGDLNESIADNTLFADYSDNRPFFEYSGLEPGYCIYVYFSLECFQAMQAVTEYEEYRNELADNLFDDASEKALYLSIMEKELESIIIKADGESGSISLTAMTIDYIRVTAKSKAPTTP